MRSDAFGEEEPGRRSEQTMERFHSETSSIHCAISALLLSGAACSPLTNLVEWVAEPRGSRGS
jgi:hypothetical protein